MNAEGPSGDGRDGEERTVPRVCVCLAAWNGATFVREQVASILGQSHRDLELVISDDGSEDGTWELCREIASKDSRVRLLPKAPHRLGLVGNFERALRAAEGHYVALADQDDVWLPEKIEVLLAALRRSPDVDLVFSDLIVVDESCAVVRPSMTRYQHLPIHGLRSLRQILIRNCVTGCATLFRRRLLERALPFPPGCRYHDWWLAVVAVAGGRAAYVDRPLIQYRQHGSNTIGASGSGAGRVLRVLRRVEDATAPRRYAVQVERLESYRSRADVFDDDRKQRDLKFALAFARGMSRLREFPLGRKLAVLSNRLRYLTPPTPVDIGVAIIGTLLPRLSDSFARRLQRAFARRSSLTSASPRREMASASDSSRRRG